MVETSKDSRAWVKEQVYTRPTIPHAVSLTDIFILTLMQDVKSCSPPTLDSDTPVLGPGPLI
ncbi:hypothetical protein E2C01_008662 [Portunus trituberculatus]|uniref:Uncharacterized protein n=1 Tax=Portunus trituberculatus TaxID=210409 RepID=A0A5B7D2Y7_PORTR|nr:hypothetical protein [Portunus trituberculatus]